ncbi:MAG: FkbM family methyltransferase [Bacteroidetes bacterium]|nr:MAG: FkbM family methyltransferase [Bacteroidota bacterium]
MNILRPILYFLIRLYSWPFRFPMVLKVTFQKLRRDTFWNYYDNVFLLDYPHIKRACSLIKSEKNPIVFDIGGGQGTTLKLFREELPHAQVELFEPISSNFKIIKDQFGGNKGIKLNQLALGHEEGETTIHIADRVTSSSLLELNPEAHEKGSYLADALKPVREESIQVKRVESFIKQYEKIHLMKLDVQGFELNVLKGAGEELKKVKYIIMEVSNHDGYSGAPLYHEIDAWMRENNFELADLFPGIKESGFLKEWDCIFLNKLWK